MPITYSITHIEGNEHIYLNLVRELKENLLPHAVERPENSIEIGMALLKSSADCLAGSCLMHFSDNQAATAVEEIFKETFLKLYAVLKNLEVSKFKPSEN